MVGVTLVGLGIGAAPAACGEIKHAFPDRETALRILGLAKGSAVALNDTVLEYKDRQAATMADQKTEGDGGAGFTRTRKRHQSIVQKDGGAAGSPLG